MKRYPNHKDFAFLLFTQNISASEHYVQKLESNIKRIYGKRFCGRIEM